eukprot:s6292_g1.t1
MSPPWMAQRFADEVLQTEHFVTWADFREGQPLTPLVSSGSGDRAPICFQQLRELTETRLRPSLRSQQLKPGDRVAALVPNGPEAASLFLSLLMCGLCYGPLDPSMTRIEIEFALRDLPASVLVLSDSLASVSVALAEMAAQSLGIKVMKLKASTDTAGLFTLRGAPGPASDPSAPIAAGYGEMPELVTRSRHEVGLALHTSGSTRRPKLVPLTHANLCSGSICIASTLQVGPSDVVMNCLPLFHIHGLVVNVLVPAIAGAVAVCLPSFDATAAAKQLKEGGISVYSAVPSAHHAILDSLPAGTSYESLRIIRNCSAHLPASLAAELERKMATEVLPTYAMTESMPIASPPLRGLHGSQEGVGVAAGPAVALRTSNGLWSLQELCPADGIEGEVCVRGGCVTSGYECRHGIDPNLEAFCEGWLKTGDLATLTSKGLVLTGRSKEIINKAGEKLSPLQIEEIYLMHTAVEDCTAFAAPCARRGEAVGLAIQAAGASTGPSCNLDGLRMFGRRTQELRSVALPDCVIWTPCLPKTATGKKLRLDLAKRFGIPPLQGDHAEWIVQSFDNEDNFVLKAAERFAAAPPAQADLRCQVHDIAKDVIRLDLDDDSALMDIGLDSLSATSLVGRLESTFNIGLAGAEGAGAFFDAYPSVALVAEEIR